MKPWLKKQETYKLNVMGATIEIRKLTFGEAKQLQKFYMGENGVKEIDLIEYQLKRLFKSIVDWDLTDEEGNKLPITLETLENLDEGFVSELIQAFWDFSEKNNHISEAKKKN
jgi:hypothetical protein